MLPSFLILSNAQVHAIPMFPLRWIYLMEQTPWCSELRLELMPVLQQVDTGLTELGR